MELESVSSRLLQVVFFVFSFFLYKCNKNTHKHWQNNENNDLCNDGYQTVKILIYKNYLEWRRFIMHLVTAPNYNENLSLYIVYNTQGYSFTYNKLICMLNTLRV